MNIQRAKNEIKNTVRAYLEKDDNGYLFIPEIRQRPILLIGPPGIGKTAIMSQVAKECGIGLVSYTMTHHTRQSALGLPFILSKEYDGKEYSVTEYTMSEIIASVYEKIEQTGLENGILFIDEINCVSETLAPVMLQFLQGKSFGNAKVPSGWIIAAAGNPPEYNRAVRPFDVVTLDRVKLINVEEDYKAWKEYSYKQKIHGAITAYLDIKTENFYHMELTVEGKQFVTARGWEDLSDLMKTYERLGILVEECVIGQYIQCPNIATDFANYLELYYKYEQNYNIENILNGIADDDMKSRINKAPFDERISLVSMILSGVNKTFREYWHCDKKTEFVFFAIKEFKECGEQIDFLLSFTEIVHEKNSMWEHKKKAELLSREEEQYMLEGLKALENMLLSLKKCESELQNVKQAEDILRSEFSQLTEEREAIISSGKKRLEYAFAFFEEVFGNEAEMLLFVTELAIGFYSMTFIEDNGCEKFFEYNKGLLKDYTREDIYRELENSGI